MKRIYPVKNKKSLRENLQNILPLMYDDVMYFKKVVVLRASAKDILHRMRIAGKPLRYAMEIGEFAFGNEFKQCHNQIKDTVELMGEIHDADVFIPEIEAQLKEVRIFNSTIKPVKEKFSTAGLRYIISDLKTKRKSMYEQLCKTLNEWEENDFRGRLIKAMEAERAHPEKVPTARQRSNRIISSRLLLAFPGLVHGMSTKISTNSEEPFYNNLSFKVGDKPENVKSNRLEFLSLLGINENRLAIPQQIHSAKIEIVDKPGMYPDRDGLITSAKNVFLVVSTADCIPVLIYDKAKKIAAGIHSGWRGTQKNIAGTAIEILTDKFNSLPSDLIVFIGPGISSKHFEVGEDVAKLFNEEFVEKREEKFYVDILANILKQLNDHGIKDNQIECSAYCTFEEKDYLHSFRRDKEKSGRMFSVIGMRAVINE